MRRIRTILTLLVTTMLLTVGMASHAVAGQPPSPDVSPTAETESAPRFVIRPHDGQDGAFFTVNAQAGTTTELTAVLGNAGEEPIDLYTFASDAVVLVNGGFGVSEDDAEQTGATTWIDWPSETFNFEPGEGIERTFTVTVPHEAEPGEYITGISLQTAEPIEVPGSTMFNQVIRKAVAVFIVVEGETSASFDLGDPEIITAGRGSRLEVPVRNTGDVLVQPAGTMILTDESGGEVMSADISMGSVYAGMDTRLSIPLDQSLAGSEYEISMSLADEDTGARASVEPQALAFSGEAAAETPVQIEESAITPMPDADEPVYVDVDLTISNSGEEISNANLVLHAQRDGELVEEFILASNMTIVSGETTIDQRYIPAEGFTEGEWTFDVSVQSVSSQSAATTQVMYESLPDAVIIP